MQGAPLTCVSDFGDPAVCRAGVIARTTPHAPELGPQLWPKRFCCLRAPPVEPPWVPGIGDWCASVEDLSACSCAFSDCEERLCEAACLRFLFLAMVMPPVGDLGARAGTRFT